MPSCIDAAHKLRDLLELEAKYGPLTGYTPAINDVLDYLKQVCKYILYAHANVCYLYLLIVFTVYTSFNTQKRRKTLQ